MKRDDLQEQIDNMLKRWRMQQWRMQHDRANHPASIHQARRLVVHHKNGVRHDNRPENLEFRVQETEADSEPAAVIDIHTRRRIL